MICDDFFNSYSRCAFPDHRQRKKRHKHKVEISCQISQFDGSQGDRLIKRRLSRLIEVDSADGDDYNLEGNDATQMEEHNSMKYAKPEHEDFLMFLRSQTSRGRSRVRVIQGSGSSSARQRLSDLPSENSRLEPGPQCFELFCVHRESLLIHRSQVLVEAERLARRLDKLSQ